MMPDLPPGSSLGIFAFRGSYSKRKNQYLLENLRRCFGKEGCPLSSRLFCGFIVAAYCVISNSSWLQRRSERNCRVCGKRCGRLTNANDLSQMGAAELASRENALLHVTVFLQIDMWPTFPQIKTYKRGTRCQTWPPWSFCMFSPPPSFMKKCVYVSACMHAGLCVCTGFTFNGFCCSEWEQARWQSEQHRRRSHFWFLCFFSPNEPKQYIRITA